MCHLVIQQNNMLETLFWFALGAFVGWNFPQPAFAKTIQARVLAMFKKTDA